MKKHIRIGILVAVLLALCLVCASATEKTHADHCVCGGNPEVAHTNCVTEKWVPLYSQADMIRKGIITPSGNNYSWMVSGNYYLAESFELDASLRIIAGTKISLCLNGKTLYGATNDKRIFTVFGDLNITDCHHSSMWGSLNARCVKTDSSNVYGAVLYQTNAADSGKTPLVNTVNLYGGKLEYSGDGQVTSGGLVYMGEYPNERSLSTFNIYDGILRGGRVAESGGAICVSNGSVLNMYGGTITDCSSQKTAGAVTIYSGGNVFTMNGGTIENCRCVTDGGGLYVSGEFYMNGGRLRNNISTREGGNVCIGSKGSMITRGDVLITGGEGSGGGNIMNFGSLKMDGGTVSLGVSGNRGGNIYMFNKGTAELRNVTVKNGKAATGGNIFAGCNSNTTGSTAFVKLYNCQVIEGHSTGSGGNITLGESGGMEMELCTVKDGTAWNSGGNVYAYFSSTYTAAGGVVGSITISNSCVVDGISLGGGDGVYCSHPLTLKGMVRITTESDARNPGLYLTSGKTVDISGLTVGSLVDLNIGDSSQPFSLGTEGGQYIRPYIAVCDVVEQEGKLYMQTPKVAVCQGQEQLGEYTFLQFAAQYAATEDTYIKLLQSRTEDVTLNKDIYLDLNGYTLDGSVELKGYDLYGMDTTTNDYGDTAGRIAATVTDGGKAAAPAADTRVETARAGDIYRYLRVAEEDGWSYQRFYLGVNTVKLWTNHAGVSYRSAFKAGEDVIAQLDEKTAYGIALSLSGPPDKLEHYSAFGRDALTAQDVNTRTTGLYNIMNTGADNNAERAEAVVYCRAYLQTSEGHVVYSMPVAMSLRQVVELIDSRYDLLTDVERVCLQQLYNRYATVMSQWELENIGKQET